MNLGKKLFFLFILLREVALLLQDLYSKNELKW